MAQGPLCNISEESLELHVLGRLCGEQSAEFEEHLLTCSECQQRAETLYDHVQAMQTALRELETEQSQRDHEACGSARTAELALDLSGAATRQP